MLKELSTRESEIVGLCVEGLTNEAIASTLGLSIGTVNTYWLRIRLKVGGQGRTDTVARIIKERAEKALRAADINRDVLANMLLEKERGLLEVRAALALFHFAMSQIKSTAWATDRELMIHIIANGEYPSTHCGVKWNVGKTVYEIFKTDDRGNVAIRAHLNALDGIQSEVKLEGEFSNMMLRVIPLTDEADEPMGCISILNVVGE